MEGSAVPSECQIAGDIHCDASATIVVTTAQVSGIEPRRALLFSLPSMHHCDAAEGREGYWDPPMHLKKVHRSLMEKMRIQENDGRGRAPSILLR